MDWRPFAATDLRRYVCTSMCVRTMYARTLYAMSESTTCEVGWARRQARGAGQRRRGMHPWSPLAKAVSRAAAGVGRASMDARAARTTRQPVVVLLPAPQPAARADPESPLPPCCLSNCNYHHHYHVALGLFHHPHTKSNEHGHASRSPNMVRYSHPRTMSVHGSRPPASTSAHDLFFCSWDLPLLSMNP